MPSTLTPGMPKAAARADRSATEVEAFGPRVDIAYWLFSQTKMTGSFQIAAMLAHSCRTPWLRAPSPKKQTLTWSVPRTGRERRAGRDAHAAADDAVRAEDAGVDVGDVHRAALALAVAGRLAEQLGHHQRRVAALGDAVAVAAVGAGDVSSGRSAAQAPTPTASMPM